MHDPPNNLDAWPPCPSGELARLAAREKARRARRRMNRLGLVAASLLFLVAAGVLVTQSNQALADRLTCRECVKLLPDYVAEKLDRRATAAVQAHLDRCRSCVRRLHKQQQVHDQLRSGEGLAHDKHLLAASK